MSAPSLGTCAVASTGRGYQIVTTLIMAGKGGALVLFVSPPKLRVEFVGSGFARDTAAGGAKKSFGCVSISDSALLAPGSGR